jgi:hypothetical protein
MQDVKEAVSWEKEITSTNPQMKPGLHYVSLLTCSQKKVADIQAYSPVYTVTELAYLCARGPTSKDAPSLETNADLSRAPI